MIEIRINWAAVLFYLTFIAYGYFAAMTSSLEEAIASPLFFLANILLSSTSTDAS